MAKNEQAVSATEQVEQRERKWLKPTKRAAGYAEERKKGVHMRGPKKGQELDAYNKGLRSGYLLAQSDNAVIGRCLSLYNILSQSLTGGSTA